MTLDAGPRLSPEETARLCRLAQGGDVEARNRVVMANYGLCHRFASRAARRGAPLDDLLQEAVLGLIRAIQTYDPDRARFSTYAVGWVRQRIGRWIEQQQGRVCIPTYVLRALPRVRRAQEQHPTAREAAAAVAEADGYPARAEPYYRATVAMDGLGVPSDELEDRHGPDIDLDAPAASGRLLDGLARLDGRSRLIVERRYGLGGGEPRTLADVSREVGISRERVRQVGDAAIRDLRAMMR